MYLTDEHRQLQRTVRAFVEGGINPCMNAGEAGGVLPAQELFKKLGLIHFCCAATKALLHSVGSLSDEDLLDQAAQDFFYMLQGTEAKEGMSAFFEKRKPGWADE